MSDLPPGDSREQREAERVMVEALAGRLSVPLEPRRVELRDGVKVEIDAATDDLSVLIEAWAHLGDAKGAQVHKCFGTRSSSRSPPASSQQHPN